MSALGERTGGCLCGAVRFRAMPLSGDAVACHCGQCRRQSGHYWASVRCDAASLTWTGAEHLGAYRASDAASRGFCTRCGSVLSWRADDEDHVSLSLGAFDDTAGIAIARDIFVEGKPDAYALDPAIPAYAAGSSAPPILPAGRPR